MKVLKFMQKLLEFQKSFTLSQVGVSAPDIKKTEARAHARRTKYWGAEFSHTLKVHKVYTRRCIQIISSFKMYTH